MDDIESPQFAPDIPAPCTPSGLRQPGSAKKQVRSSGTGGAPTCYLCEKGGDLTKVWRSRPFHDRCHNAIRCHLRLLKGKDEEQRDNIRMFEEAPDDWRALVLPIVGGASGRSSAARAALKQKVKSSEHFKKSSQINDKILLSKTRYKSYKKFWDAVSDSEASQEWDELYSQQGKRLRNQQGLPAVAIMDNTVLRSEKGQENRTVQERSSGSAGAAPSSVASAALMEDSSEDDQQSVRSFGSAASNLPSTVAHSWRSHKQRFLSEQRLREPEPPAATRNSSGASEGQDGADSEQGSPEAPAPSATGTPQKPPEKLSLVEVIQLKATLRKDAEQAVHKVVGNKGLVAKLRSSDSALSAEQRGKLDVQTTQVVQKLENAAEEVNNSLAQIDTVRPAELRGFQDNLQKRLETMRMGEELGKQHLDAIEYLVGEDRKGARAKKAHDRYEKSKVVNQMCKAGYGNNQARRIVARLTGDKAPQELKETHLVNPTEFSASAVAVWSLPEMDLQGNATDNVGAAAAPAFNMASIASEFEQLMVENIRKKTESITQVMVEKHTEWSGCLAKLLEQSSEFDWHIGEFLDKTHPGAAPVLLASRRHAWRWGAGVLPFQGVPSIIKACSSGVTVIVHSVADLLAQGIVLRDMHAFLESPSGQKYFDSCCQAFALPIGAVAYIPAGKVVSLLTATFSGDAAPEIGFAWALPLFLLAEVQKLPVQTNQAFLV